MRSMGCLIAWTLCGLTVAACRPTQGPEDSGPGCGFAVEISAGGIHWVDSCRRASLGLLPAVRLAGEFVGAGAAGDCRVERERVVCPVDQRGEVSAWVEGDTIQVGFRAAADLELEGFALEGALVLPGARAWLSNGFQSWSQSGALAIGERIDDAALATALSARGDAEVLRSGRELSWWHTWVAGGDLSLVAGALRAERFKPWAQVQRSSAGELRLRLACGGAGERVALAPGQELAGEPWRVELGENLQDLLDRYGRLLPSRRSEHPSRPEAGWNSWYQLWDEVDAVAVLANADLAAEALAGHLPPGARPRVVIDDGWQQAWGQWWPNQKFPSGLDGLATELQAAGFEVGIWLAPLLVDEDTALVAEHPDWFVAGPVFGHLEHGAMRVLDVTHPEAAEHLAQVVARIVSWGIDLLKIDFLFAGTWEGGRREAITGLQAYARALQIIRQAAGPQVALLAVGAPPVAGWELVDSWRLGGDIAFERFGPSWFFAVNQARSLGARWPYCLAVLCDPDPPLLRALQRPEVEFGAWVVGLAGGGLFLSDDLRALPVERRAWLPAEAAAAALSGLIARPEDLVPADPPARLSSAVEDLFNAQNSQVIPVSWRLGDGRRLVLNPSEQPIELGDVQIPARGAGLIEE